LNAHAVGDHLVQRRQMSQASAVQKRNVSMVYQQFINYPNLTVFDNIASPLRVGGLSCAEIKSRMAAMSRTLLRLSPMLDRKPSELSGGQQQRTAMARALVKDSDLVLLDEPLANLDFKLREELREELPRLFETATAWSSTRPPSLPRRCCLGGIPRPCMRAVSPSSARPGDIYRRALDLTTARVFSDPPINTAPFTKQGRTLSDPWRVGLSGRFRQN
jgi:glycerol transport system ATP-binding protein